VGILFRLILQGILAYVLKKGAVSSSRATVSTGQAIIQGGARAAADETLAEVSTLLRNSKLPDGFVVWLEKNWDDLKRNPTLASNKTGTNGSSQPSSSPATPSELKAMRDRQGRDDVAETSGNESKPVAERTNHEKAAFGERTAHDKMMKKGYEPVGSTDGNYYPGKQGIDGVYKNPSPPPDYVITEVKYGTADLGMTKDGKQMSDSWLTRERLIDKVGEENADAIRQSAKRGNVEKWLIKVDEHGSTSIIKLEKNANNLGKLTPF